MLNECACVRVSEVCVQGSIKGLELEGGDACMLEDFPMSCCSS